MTVATIDPVITDVMLMAELNGLLLLQVTAGYVRRSGDLRINIKSRTRNNDTEDHADPRDVVCTLVKKLRHLSSLPLGSVNKPQRLPGWWVAWPVFV